MGVAIVKRLGQSALSTAVTNRYTATVGYTGQVTEIWIVNTGATDRTVTLYQGGTGTTNMLGIFPVPAGGTVLLQDLKIVVASGQSMAAKQDVGTDITMTLFGVEEN